MCSYYKNKIFSDGPYRNALFGLLNAWSIIIRCIGFLVCHCLILRRMYSYCERKISSDGAYLSFLFWFFIAWSITIICTRTYLYPCLILIRMHSHFENTICSDGAYCPGLTLDYWLHLLAQKGVHNPIFTFVDTYKNAKPLFGILIPWISLIRFTRSYFCPCLIHIIMDSHYENRIISDCDYLHGRAQ